MWGRGTKEGTVGGGEEQRSVEQVDPRVGKLDLAGQDGGGGGGGVGGGVKSEKGMRLEISQ